MVTGSRFAVWYGKDSEGERTLGIKLAHKPRRCNSRANKTAVKKLWMIRQTSYGRRPCMESRLNKNGKNILVSLCRWSRKPLHRNSEYHYHYCLRCRSDFGSSECIAKGCEYNRATIECPRCDKAC